ncbi:MAG: fatty acid desaturase family protein [Bdellovibrionota bacterium]
MDKKTYLEIREKLAFSPRRWALGRQLLEDLAILGCAGAALSTKTIAGFGFAQILLACLYFRAFSMMHDAVHRSVSERPRLNDWLGVIYGGLCFLPFITWRSMHLEHHSWVGNFEKDPVMKMVRGFPQKSALHRQVDTLLWRSWLPYIALLQELVFWTVSAKFIFERSSQYEGKRLELVASLAAPLAIAAAVICGGIFLGGWALMLPSIVIYLAMVEVINLPHHLRMPRLPGDGQLSLWNQYKVSRTCVYSAWFSRFVLLNFNYHAEHHMFPTLPWYELPKAYALVKECEPEGYHLGIGHEWILENRQKNLSVVFAPTEVLLPDSVPERKAA